ncbi:protein-glutamate methylesterase/protein-glutamine glutaminase [Agilicoccus flavus]|uniref:protein-glutamate methylesterase/protein-glutamine glutaminase n=1 Tax=Agilicoccus flavus TaxID=2775968 RepID=UPI001CF6EFD4|nr:chemotaxis response regulator protein-glutamate methylesterase [Agilicoccus flavus]
MAPRIRVLVTDDSIVLRRLITDVLATDPEIEVVGTAVNGKNALDKLPVLKPDVMTLDIEMPVMDGLQTILEVRKRDKRLPIIMFSTLTERGAGATLDALERGASDYVTKPANVGSVKESMEAVRSQLIPKIKSLTGRSVAPQRARPAFGGPPPPGSGGASHGPGHVGFGPNGQAVAAVTGSAAAPTGRVDVVAIAVSTGGPDALTQVVSNIPAGFPVPIVVTQHMPPVFTQLFGQRLDAKARLKVSEAANGDVLMPGKLLIAPGDFHMRFVRRGGHVSVALDKGPQENYCRPAADPMFRSVTEVYGGNVLALIMTGMGSDGFRGAEHVVHAGGSLVVQDEATSVVWGMPGAAVAAGLPCEIVPLGRLADTIAAKVSGRASASAAAHPVATAGRGMSS